jgi:hypothetical protein
MYIEHRGDRVTPQWAAFHGASANPASPPTNRRHLFNRFQMALLLWPTSKKCTAQIALIKLLLTTFKTSGKM